MSEHSSIVKGIYPKQSPNGKSYWQIIWNDNSKDNIFNADWMDICKKSQAENRLVNFTRELTTDGKFKNIKSLELATLPVKSPNATSTSLGTSPQTLQDGQGTALPTPTGTGQPAKTEMTKDEWAEREKITRKSIERQTALNAAIELAKSNTIALTEIIQYARRFEAFLAGNMAMLDKEVQPAKTKLVDEAKKLGAEEIKKGETTT